LGVDAALVSDLGAFLMLRREAPDLPLHISTQANTLNAEAARFYYEQGAERIVLARELSLAEIRAIREAVSPALEIEAFAHGAMCVSYSGRCLLSNYMTGRDSNRGECAQPCRYQYALMEEKRPGEYFPVFEDEKGKMNLNLETVGGALLVVSQFTLYADLSSRRPGFSHAAKPDLAIPLYEHFMACCREKGFTVEHGEFGADMQVESVNDGPVTLIFEI
jgi:hypothetical protein